MAERIAFFDCFSGASGDMLLGALMDAGLPVEKLQEDIDKLHCGPIKLSVEKVMRGGIAGTKANINFPHEHAHRGLSEIRTIIEESDLPERVKADSIAVFSRLAEAEAAIHAVPVDKIHFHEVGALDAIADIVGAVAGLNRLGISEIRFSTLRLGGGTVKAAHGTLPVPAPATAKLVQGLVCEMGPVDRELLTPTGAAILTTLGKQGLPEEFGPSITAYGAGNADFEGHPNLLRLMIGERASSAESDRVWVLEANLDDMTAETCGYALERLLAEGALEAFVVPIQMKKSRPGWLLSAIADARNVDAIEEVFFKETTTFGVRKYEVARAKLTREHRTVSTEYGEVRVKVGMRHGKVVTASPEYEDCRKAAAEKDAALRDVMAAAMRAFNQ